MRRATSSLPSTGNGSRAWPYPRLRYSGEPRAVIGFTAIELNGHIENLLAAIETRPPEVVAAQITTNNVYASPGRVGEPIVSRAGLVSADTLKRYDYLTPDEQALARLLLEATDRRRRAAASLSSPVADG